MRGGRGRVRDHERRKSRRSRSRSRRMRSGVQRGEKGGNGREEKEEQGWREGVG